MKKSYLFFILFALCFNLTSCGSPGASGQPSGGSQPSLGAKDLFNSQTSIFNSLNVEFADAITADFEVYLSETDVTFLCVDAKEDTDAILSYTYSKDEGPVKLFYGPKEGTELSSITLDSGASSGDIEGTEDIVLKKGMNLFYMTGTDCTCQMSVKIDGYSKGSIVSADMVRPDEG